MALLTGISAFMRDLFFRVVPALASLLAIWEVLKALFRRAMTRSPVRSVLGDLADDKVPCMVFVNHLFTPQRDNTYSLRLPDYFPPGTTGREDARVNIPYVLAKSDSTAVADLLNAVGQAGRYRSIEIVDPVTHWEKWDASIVCVGGSFKSERVWEKCRPPVAIEGSSLKISLTGERLRAAAPQDFGVLCKTRNPENGRDVWLIIGVGVYGTEAAGYFLRTNVRTLGRMFGKSAFTVVVRTTLMEGGRQASLWWYTPEVSLWRQIIFRRTYRSFCRRREPILGIRKTGEDGTESSLTTQPGRTSGG
jgi:hypothetical protein